MKKISIVAILACMSLLTGCNIETTGTGPGTENWNSSPETPVQSDTEQSYEAAQHEAPADTETDSTEAPKENTAPEAVSEPASEQSQTVNESSYNSGQTNATEAPATEIAEEKTHEAIELPVVALD
ncbi:MAG: hypothetical protein J5724_04285 [Ruminococcus sp.]|nr:hypothetical protein [Ruminococcus sp.]